MTQPSSSKEFSRAVSGAPRRGDGRPGSVRRSVGAVRVRVVGAAVVLVSSLLLVAVVGPSAEAQRRPPLPVGPPNAPSTLAPKSAPIAPLSVSPTGPTTLILDDFNRPDEDPLSQGGAWSPVDPRGAGFHDLLSVVSNQAANIRTGFGAGTISYRTTNFPDSFEAYATIAVKPVDGTGATIVFNILQEGSHAWDGYYLSWRPLAGPDQLAITRIINHNNPTLLASKNLEYASGDKLMVRRVGALIEAWVYQSGAWSLQLTANDATLSGGKIGLNIGGASPLNPGRFDDFGAGPYTPPPPPPLEQSTGTCGIGVHAYSRSACRGHGVNTLTGAFTTQAVDLALPGIGVPLRWTRTYSSNASGAGGLGPGWTHGFATSFVDQGPPLVLGPTGNNSKANGEEPTDFKLFGDEGQEILYRVNPEDGSFTGAPGSQSKLARRVEGGFEVFRKDQVLYTYNESGRLTSIEDRNGQGLTFEYQPEPNEHRLARILDSVGREITIAYTGDLIASVTLPDERSVEYGYTDGRLTSIVDARGETTTYRYDAAGRLDRVVDIVNEIERQVVRNEYHPETERVAKQWDAHEQLTTFEGDPDAGGEVTMTDARMKEWVDVYDGGVIDERRNPLGETTSFEYDLDLNVTQITDPRQNTTRMEYDDAGNLTKRTTPAPFSDVEEWTYTARNDPLTYEDGRGNVTDFGYDGAGNLTSVVEPDADGPGPLGRPETVYERDPAGTGLVEAIVDPLDKRTEFSYLDGNLTEILTDLGHQTRMGYDASGRMDTLIDARGNEVGANPADFTWTFEYNNHDQLHKQFDPLDHVTELRYDPVGNLEKQIDAKLHETVYAYDEANRLKTVTAPDPDGPDPLLAPVTQYTYDEVGNLETKTDAEQRVTVYEYDDANRPSKTTAPDNRVWTYEYDDNGNVDFMVDANGNASPTVGDGLTDYVYDALNRLTGVNYSDATPDVVFDYDANSNRTQLTDGSGTETYTYDALNNLKTVTRGSTAFSYLYDLSSNVTQTTYPDSPAVSATYDDDGRLATIASDGLTTSYGYDAAGNVKTTTLPSGNGHVETRGYDRAGRLFDLEHKRGATTLARFVADLDPVGDPTEIVRTGSHALTQTYSYDNLDRLTGVCFQAGTCPGAGDPFIRWTYDRVGNRPTETRPAGTTTYAYNDADELTARSGLGGPVTYGYDQNGNQTAEGSKSYAYDLAGRMTSATSGSGTATYAYDGLGKRLQAVGDSPPAAPTLKTPCPTAIGTSGTATVPKPTGTVAGDLLIVGLAFEKGTDSAITPPSGWTLIRRTNQSSNVGYATYRKTAGASEPASYSFALTNSPKWSIGACAIAGAHATTPVEANAGNSGSSGNPSAPSVNTSGPERLVLAFYANKKPTTFSNYTPPPATERWDRPNTSGGLPSNAMASYTPAAGPTGNKNATPGEAAEWVAQQVAIAPGASHTKFLWDINHPVPQLALERDANDVLQRRYLYGLARIAQTAGTTSYYHADSLGSVVHLTSDTGATQRTLSYEPFGLERTNTGPGPGTSFKFTGEYQDGTELYHLRARQYDPKTGRFLTRDPVPSTGSAYAYAGNMPTVFGDPSGLWLEWLDDAGHILLDIGGVVPLIGEPADLLNCAWYEAQGNHLDASFSCGAAIPILGWGAVVAKWGWKGAKLVDAAKAGDDVVYHYTDDVGRGAIEKSGQIRNPNPGGENFFTPSKFCSGAQARECLAMGRTPTGYFEVPSSRLPGSTRGPFAVQGPRGPTGAYEYMTPDPVDVAGLPFRPFPGVAP